MSDLQIALLLIGILIVVAVLIFNWNQERRFKKQAAAAFPPLRREITAAREVVVATPPPPESQVESGRREPVLHNLDVPFTDRQREPGMERQPLENEPSAHHAVLPGQVTSIKRPDVAVPSPLSSPVPEPIVVIPAAPYDELIEFRVCMTGDGILAAMFAEDFNVGRGMGKAIRWMGFPVKGTAWEEVQPWREAFYREVQVTLQLADRNGAIHEEELNGLCTRLKATAQTHGLKIVCDDVPEAIQRAQSVDHFCVDVDVLIGLNVVARGEGAMKLAKVLKEVETTGMVLGVDGAYRLLDSRGEALYSLCNHDAEPFSYTALQQDTQAVTLQFDVPRVPDGLKVFDSMVSFGRKLANEVGGLLVDDNMRPLTEGGIDKIRQQLAGIYQRMEARGVPSGSRRALRLFS